MRGILDFKVMLMPLVIKGVYLRFSAGVIAVPGAVFCARIP